MINELAESPKDLPEIEIKIFKKDGKSFFPIAPPPVTSLCGRRFYLPLTAMSQFNGVLTFSLSGIVAGNNSLST